MVEIMSVVLNNAFRYSYDSNMSRYFFWSFYFLQLYNFLPVLEDILNALQIPQISNGKKLYCQWKFHVICLSSHCSSALIFVNPGGFRRLGCSLFVFLLICCSAIHQTSLWRRKAYNRDFAFDKLSLQQEHLTNHLYATFFKASRLAHE